MITTEGKPLPSDFVVRSMWLALENIFSTTQDAFTTIQKVHKPAPIPLRTAVDDYFQRSLHLWKST